MHLETVPTCHDFQKRVDLFLDGELEGRVMRSLAMHSARCEACERLLRESEEVQETFGDTISAEADRVDVSDLWRSIEVHLNKRSPSLMARLRERWGGEQGAMLRQFSAIAAGIALFFLAASSWLSLETSVPEQTVSNRAQIDSLTSSAPAVAVWNEPYQQTTAIWVASFEP